MRSCLLVLLTLCALVLCCRGADDSERMIDFYKHLFSELGQHRGDIAATLTPEIRVQYAQLEEARASTSLGTALAAVVELRIMDLEISLRHTRRLLEAVQLLGDGGGGVI